MAKCKVCGNDYDKTFTITQGAESHVFGSFECAIHGGKTQMRYRAESQELVTGRG